MISLDEIVGVMTCQMLITQGSYLSAAQGTLYPTV